MPNKLSQLFGALELSTLGTFCEPEKGLLMRGYQFSVATPSTVTYLRVSELLQFSVATPSSMSIPPYAAICLFVPEKMYS